MYTHKYCRQTWSRHQSKLPLISPERHSTCDTVWGHIVCLLKSSICMGDKIAYHRRDSKQRSPSSMLSALISKPPVRNTCLVVIWDTISGGMNILFVKFNTWNANRAWSTASIFNCWKVVMETVVFFLTKISLSQAGLKPTISQLHAECLNNSTIYENWTLFILMKYALRWNRHFLLTW